MSLLERRPETNTERQGDLPPRRFVTIMAGSATKTVHDIFQSMEYGPAATSSTATAQVKLSTELSTEEKMLRL